jgi:T4 RnlA family RNA ligase
VNYQVFLYRWASYSRWTLDEFAVESRGITFQMEDNQPERLVSWPFEKFFNLHENPMTTNVDLSNPKEILLKEDGSLISTVDTHKGLWLKSKGSFHSPQAQQALQLLQTENYQDLHCWVKKLVKLGFTVNMEYTAPQNWIVVP